MNCRNLTLTSYHVGGTDCGVVGEPTDTIVHGHRPLI